MVIDWQDLVKRRISDQEHIKNKPAYGWSRSKVKVNLVINNIALMVCHRNVAWLSSLCEERARSKGFWCLMFTQVQHLDFKYLVPNPKNPNCTWGSLFEFICTLYKETPNLTHWHVFSPLTTDHKGRLLSIFLTLSLTFFKKISFCKFLSSSDFWVFSTLYAPRKKIFIFTVNFMITLFSLAFKQGQPYCPLPRNLQTQWRLFFIFDSLS